MEENYSKRELDEFIKDIHGALLRIEVQTSKTNGRVTFIEKILLVAGTVIAVLLLTNGSKLLEVFKLLI